MLAYHSPAASLPQTTNLTLPVARPAGAQKSCFRSSSNRKGLPVKAVTLKDLTLEHTEQRSFVQPAAEDFLQHPSQVLDNRQLLQEYVRRRSQLFTSISRKALSPVTLALGVIPLTHRSRLPSC